MFESIAHKFDSAKPAGDANDAVTHLLFLHDTQDDHAGPGFAIVGFGLVDETVLRDSGSPSVLSGLGVLFV
jgi:hypothetical protein